MYIPKELVTYSFKSHNMIYLFVISAFQGWSIFQVLAKYAIGTPTRLYFEMVPSKLKSYTALWQSSCFGFYKNYQNYLKLKGMGYKMSLTRTNLILKLGHSHRILFHIKGDLKINYLTRQLIKIESRNLNCLKNTIYDFCRMGKLNSYKKKGFFLKGSILRIKISSKKSKF